MYNSNTIQATIGTDDWYKERPRIVQLEGFAWLGILLSVVLIAILL